jgi:serine/threonine protein kinase
VYLGKDKTTGTLVAIKKLVIIEDEDFEEILKEIEIMKECSSPYVVTYYGSYWKREENEMWVSVMSHLGRVDTEAIHRL